jgi:hypothetical protein
LWAFFGAYAYRDVFPFATFDRFPEDWEEGWILWAKVAILFLIALAYPLGVPWQYIPVNPEVSTVSGPLSPSLITTYPGTHENPKCRADSIIILSCHLHLS